VGKKQTIIREIGNIPEPFLDEVLDFIRFIKTKIAKEKLDVTLASESSLKKDWLRLEEVNYWKHL
jgi:hypothetical protein